MKYNSAYKWQLVSVPQSIALCKEACRKGAERQGSNEISSMHLSSECVAQRSPPQPSRHSSHITLVPTPIINGLCFSCYIQLHIIPKISRFSHSFISIKHPNNIHSYFNPTWLFSVPLFPYSSYSIITFFTYILWKAGGVLVQGSAVTVLKMSPSNTSPSLMNRSTCPADIMTAVRHILAEGFWLQCSFINKHEVR
jgi:hypothetical protein